jgi:hypothetical protein
MASHGYESISQTYSTHKDFTRHLRDNTTAFKLDCGYDFFALSVLSFCNVHCGEYSYESQVHAMVGKHSPFFEGEAAEQINGIFNFIRMYVAYLDRSFDQNQRNTPGDLARARCPRIVLGQTPRGSCSAGGLLT